jgi:hypothetical protein
MAASLPISLRMPRSLVHVLLSLLLLFSQQLAQVHVYSHAGEVREALAQQSVSEQVQQGGGKLHKPLLHGLCSHCAAGAQLAFALPVSLYLFLPAELAFALLTAPRTPAVCLLTVCVFQPRGPPQA